MPLDEDAWYVALTERNPDYEGVFYVGVRTTGVFCRPTCPARLPKRANCEFFPNAQQALLASYRPCRALPALVASQRDFRPRAPARRCGRARAR